MLPRLSATEKLRFDAEIVPHLDVLHRMARSVCGDDDVADDIAQESFLKALKGFGGLKPGTNGRSWLARIVHNACRDHWRSKAGQGDESWDDELQAEVDALGGEPDWQPGIIRDAFDDEICEALRALPPRWRASVLLVDVEGWTYEEAAESLEIAPGTLRSGLHRARKVLFARLRDSAGARQRGLEQPGVEQTPAPTNPSDTGKR